ncbi:MAG: sigma-54 dependent transcriptional regulator [Bacteroidales bacterium]|jgi:DNA-binding NtrC family response regulator|nr:sigma-54 dependent transcriptional regulator [Bacteroidales bacterium]
MAKNILIIDDEQAIRASLRDILEYEAYEVDDVEDGKKALELISTNTYDAILCDIKMSKIDGLEVLEKGVQLTNAAFIMISGHGTIETAVDALKKGAYDFITKPLDLNRLLVSLRNAFERNKLIETTRQLSKKVKSEYKLIGESKEWLEVMTMADRIAPTDARVLILGANGTGKELVARHIHANSHRAENPFIEVNCAAIPNELIESQLFGHEKGSFTSAIKQKKGDFELADNGTIFLDEIGDMSLAAQAKVLRALQENKITRVGGEKDININVRIIAATNKNIQTEIAEGRFREDLYHRLSVIVLNLPALKDRKSDLPMLCNYYVEYFCKQQNKAILSISDEAIILLENKDWTGNIRELRNVMERLVILCDKEITAEDIARYA